MFGHLVKNQLGKGLQWFTGSQIKLLRVYIGYIGQQTIFFFFFTNTHNAFECASSRAPLGRLFAQVAWLRGYDLRQSTRLKFIPSCPAGRVIGLGTSGLSAPDYFGPTIIREKLVATDARWLWMESSISYILCQLRLRGPLLIGGPAMIHY